LAAAVGYVIGIAPRWLRVTRLQIALPELPAAWDGLRIAHLSDFHANAPLVTSGFLANAKRTALRFDPDLVAITGDFFENGRWSDTGELYRRWPARTPVIAVLGNHDYRGGPDNLDHLLEQLCESDIHLLRNSAATLELRGRRAWIAGVDDPHTFRHDVCQALAAVPNCEELLLFLTHSPVAVNELPVSRARLILAGHTHGGQVRLWPSGQVPFIHLIRRLRGLPRRPDPPIYRGWSWERGAVLIVSDGIGVSSLPIRFRTRPQVILIELTRAEPDGEHACDDVQRYVSDESGESRLSRWLT
jgi:hypothetical protein